MVGQDLRGHLVPILRPCPWGPVLWTLTLWADALEDKVQILPADAGCLHELLLCHAAQLQAADVEMAERDAVGIQLVLVTAELEPFPDVALRPVLGVDGCPVGVASCTMKRQVRDDSWERIRSPPEEALILLMSSSSVQWVNGASSPGVFFWDPSNFLSCSENQRHPVCRLIGNEGMRGVRNLIMAWEYLEGGSL